MLTRCGNVGGMLLQRVSFSPDTHKTGQTRMAPAASQGYHKQFELSCKCFLPPKKHIHDLLQTFHVISHLWTRPCNWRLHPPSEFLWRERSILRPPSGCHHIRRRGYCHRLAPRIHAMQDLQADWFCLGVRVVHPFLADDNGPPGARRSGRWVDE